MQIQATENNSAIVGTGYRKGLEGRQAQSLLGLEAAVASFRALDARIGTDDAVDYHLVVSNVHALLSSILELEGQGIAREVIKASIAEVRHIHAKSPLISRMQNWPRGHAGDYETVEMILGGRCLSPRGTLAYHLERYLLDCPASQQHRNKVAVQADRIRFTINENPESAILVVACGGCPDLRLLSKELKAFRGQLWLNDIDKEALQCSIDAISPVVANIKAVHGNVVELLRAAKSLPRFDLILAGGLFDYLEDRVARFVIKGACSCLCSTGRFFFTNIGQNPYRPWMEYCGEWFLRERTANDLKQLALQSGVPAASVSLLTETTGLTHLVELTKGCQSSRE
jgi:extracellular factor (EF) 3-hydroxypalmitic acid methyl ester biosynthesis protein